jgi:hypothetical protein
MPRKAKAKLTAADVAGLKFFKPLGDLLGSLREGAHGNREYHFDQHVSLLLLLFFNPVLTSLRSLQQATEIEKVQKKLGVKRASLGSMSESAASVFDPDLLRAIVLILAERCRGVTNQRKLAEIAAEVCAVDGSFMRCVPSMTWAIFRSQSERRGIKLHMHLDLRSDTPMDVEVTPANGSEKRSLEGLTREAVLYVLDRGYIEYALYQSIHEARAFFVARIKDNSACDVVCSRPLTDEDRQAGVIADEEVTVGSSFTRGELTAPVRRVIVVTPDEKRLVFLTNELTVSAETIAVLYRCRWQVELFFRWFKCVLGCNHWTSRSPTGVTIQVYAALIASMLISLWTGRKPTKRTYEMVCLYFQGWATYDELQRHIASLKPVA